MLEVHTHHPLQLHGPQRDIQFLKYDLAGINNLCNKFHYFSFNFFLEELSYHIIMETPSIITGGIFILQQFIQLIGIAAL